MDSHTICTVQDPEATTLVALSLESQDSGTAHLGLDWIPTGQPSDKSHNLHLSSWYTSPCADVDNLEGPR